MEQGEKPAPTAAETDRAAVGAARAGCETPLLDEGHVASLERILGRHRVSELLQRLALRIPAHLEAIDRAIADSDRDELFREAHGLKGAASMLGLARLTAATQRLCLAANGCGHPKTIKDEVRAAAEVTLQCMAERVRSVDPVPTVSCTPCAPGYPGRCRPAATGR